MRTIPLNVLILTLFLLPSVFILNSCDDKNKNPNKSKDTLSEPQSMNSGVPNSGDSGSSAQGSGSTGSGMGK